MHTFSSFLLSHILSVSFLPSLCRWRGGVSEHDKECTSWASSRRHYGMHHVVSFGCVCLQAPDPSPESSAHVASSRTGWVRAAAAAGWRAAHKGFSQLQLKTYDRAFTKGKEEKHVWGTWVQNNIHSLFWAKEKIKWNWNFKIVAASKGEVIKTLRD